MISRTCAHQHHNPTLAFYMLHSNYTPSIGTISTTTTPSTIFNAQHVRKSCTRRVRNIGAPPLVGVMPCCYVNTFGCVWTARFQRHFPDQNGLLLYL